MFVAPVSPSRGIELRCGTCQVCLPKAAGSWTFVTFLTLRQKCWNRCRSACTAADQDMYILKRSCAEEIVRSFLARALGVTQDYHPAPPHTSRSLLLATFTSSNNSTSHRILIYKWGHVSRSVLTSIRLEAKNTLRQ